MGGSWDVPGAAPMQLVDGASRLLRPDEQVFESMLDGWVNQQLARSLKRSTIDPRVALVRRFQRYTNDYPPPARGGGGRAPANSAAPAA